MIKTLNLTLGCLLFISQATFAGQSGYILNGKTVITHKDGEAHEESAAENNKRTPASANRVKGTLFFDEDDLARCYWLANQASLQCIKKK
ncbi:MAG: hypothetical protein RJB66_2480 [Pseudomonadota bacterium]|jgi:hypothetical protein